MENLGELKEKFLSGLIPNRWWDSYREGSRYSLLDERSYSKNM